MCDLISNLPEDLKENILVRLPLKEAVRTSTLSKRWRYNWITISDLVFYDSTFSLSLGVKQKELPRSEILLLIHQVLSQHQGPIYKFKLDIYRLGSCHDIDHLINFLTRKSVKKLELNFSHEKHQIVSRNLFYCLQLRTLRLRACALQPPPEFSGFAKLTKISFNYVDLPDKFAENFVAKCPLLERLVLDKCTNIECISFFAPNLKLLAYRGGVRYINFEHTPALKSVYIGQYHDDSSEFQKSLVGNTCLKAFSYLGSLECLEIGWHLMPILAMGTVPNSLARDLTCLVTLDIRSTSLDNVRISSCVLCLIKSSPNLQKLTVQLSMDKVVEDPLAAEVFLEAKDSMCSLEKLKSVDISWLEGLRSEMEFIKLVLVKSPVLESMYLKMPWAPRKNGMVLQETNQSPRASPSAKVILTCS